MEENKKITSALISVYHKDGLLPILQLLADNGVRLISTGGTHKFITEQGFECDTVESLTGYPSILGGRVKTLHPTIFGGILNRRDNKQDAAHKEEYNIPDIDLVIVDLYPFEETVASNATREAIIEKIDIGGISLIRGAAKNYNDVVIVASKAQYEPLLKILQEQGANTTLEQRFWFAKEAFGVSSAYDSHIFNYFDEGNFSKLRICEDGKRHLRYGQNPHQKANFYGDFDSMFIQLHGKEISYNNLLDIDAAVRLIGDFEEPTFAILKHNNACGIASRPTIAEAWTTALECDPVSAFGGVLVANREIDKETAEGMNKIFFEVSIAPGYTAEALEILKKKKNRILLVQKETKLPTRLYRTAINGILEEEADTKVETAEDMRQVCERKATEREIADLIFANKVVKHSKSNAIVLAKDGRLLASGVGQTSRVDALKQAIEKARGFNFDLRGAVMASDAFFPFADCVELAFQAGVRAVIHPGGSIRDGESRDFCNKNDMAMIVTGFRHFKH